MFLGSEVSELMGVSGQDEDWTVKMRNVLNLFPVRQEKGLGSLEVVDFGEPGGVYSVFMLEDVASISA